MTFNYAARVHFQGMEILLTLVLKINVCQIVVKAAGLCGQSVPKEGVQGLSDFF